MNNLELSRFDDPDPRESIPGYVDLHDLFHAPPHKETWIAPYLVPEGRMVSLVGPAKSGKSLLALNCAAAIASGRPFLGEPTIQSTVLYIDQENIPISDVKPRLEQMGYTWQDLKTHFIYSSYGRFEDFNTRKGADNLMKLIREHNVQVVIIDTISRVVTGKENDNDTWNDLHKHLESQLKREGISMLRLDHTGKDTDKGPRGGSAKLGDVDMTVTLTAQRNGNMIHLTVDGHRMPLTWAKLHLEKIHVPLLDFIIKEEKTETTAQRIQRLVELLDRHGFERRLTVIETRNALASLNQRISNDVASAVTKARKTNQATRPMNRQLRQEYHFAAATLMSPGTLQERGTKVLIPFRNVAEIFPALN